MYIIIVIEGIKYFPGKKFSLPLISAVSFIFLLFHLHVVLSHYVILYRSIAFIAFSIVNIDILINYDII